MWFWKCKDVGMSFYLGKSFGSFWGTIVNAWKIMTDEIHSQIFRCRVNPTYLIYAQDITELQNLYLGLQNTQLQLICGPLDVSWPSFFLDRLVCLFYFHVNLFECWCQISTKFNNFLGWSFGTFLQNGIILIFCLYIITYLWAVRISQSG